jgi:hypothetical protein
MNIPKTEKPQSYVGLYAIDFGDSSSLGYRADEVACLLESEKFAEAKVYKVHRALPDGTMELAGVSRERFELESGMFFAGLDEASSRRDFELLLNDSQELAPPCRAKWQLACNNEGQFVCGLIYPAEYEQEMGQWLTEIGFMTKGTIEAGVSQVERYYQQKVTIERREQLWPDASNQGRDFATLLGCVGLQLQR